MKQKSEIPVQKDEIVPFILKSNLNNFIMERQDIARKRHEEKPDEELKCYLYCYPLKCLIEEIMLHLNMSEESFELSSKYVKHVHDNVVDFCSKSRIVLAGAIIVNVGVEMAENKKYKEWRSVVQVCNLLNCSTRAVDKQTRDILALKAKGEIK